MKQTATKSKTDAKTVSKTAPKKAVLKTKSASKAKAKSNGTDASEQPHSLLEKFFHDQLKDIYYAENKLLTAIPKMESAATTDELKDAFNDHLHQTKKQVKRLDKVFKLLGQKPEGKKCEAIEGLIKEAESIISETKEGSMTRDAALIMAAQKVEHYEIATYGGLVQLAITVGQREVSDILDETLMEEEDTDCTLTHIAESYVNIEAEEEALFAANKPRNKPMKASVMG